MQIGILGPLEVRVDGEPAEIPGQRVRRLLERLAVDAPRTVSIGELVLAVWAEDRDSSADSADAPANVTNALQSLVSRLRRSLGNSDLVQQRPGGYALDVAADAIDLRTFEQTATAGRSALLARDWDRAAELLDHALGLWRGDPLSDAGDADYAQAVRVRCDEARLEAVADRIEADLRRGRSAERVVELEELVAALPWRERFTGLLMTALAETGRHTEALTAYERHRVHVADELGADPSPVLQEQHLALLRGEARASTRTTAHNLPAGVTRFLGRDEELEQVDRLLHTSRLVTIVGPGGSGKTRLAVESAALALGLADDDGHDDGGDHVYRRSTAATELDEAWLVELAPVTSPDNLVGAFLTALGLRETHLLDRTSERVPRDDTDRLFDALRDSGVLLVVDNCEHLLDAAASLVERLLARCPRLRVVATSREPLGIAGEALCQLPPLGLPAADASVEQAAGFAAVQLFVERATDASPGFILRDANVAAVVDIVRRLDGLPLAIELAAARLRVLPLEEIARRLSDRFALLTSGSRTAMPRHRTLRAVVDWSWELMTDDERDLAMRLAVLPGGATVESATAVCEQGTDDLRVADVLDALVDKSWIRREPVLPLRYRMLETMREYGEARLAEYDRLEAARERHAQYFADLVARNEPRLRTADQIEAIGLLNAERDNITTALRFLGERGDARGTLDMAVGLSWYWVILGAQTEPVTWLSFALRVPGETDPVARILAEILLAASSMDPSSGSLDEQSATSAIEAVQRLSTLNDELQVLDSDLHPMLPLMKSVVAMFAQDDERLPATIEEALSSADPWVRACTRMFRANVAENSGDVTAMRADVDQAVKEFEEIGDRWGLASSLSVRGRLLTLDGHLDAATDALEEGQQHLRALGARGDEQMTLIRLADLDLRRGDVPAARERANQVDNLAEQRGSSIHATIARAALVGIEVVAGDEAAARRWATPLLDELARFPPAHPLQGHGRAIALTATATVEIVFGDLDVALPLLVEGYPGAVGTRDLPILATFGVAVAEYAERRGARREAAEILGAAARLRGADDWTDTHVRRVITRLRGHPDLDVDAAYAVGLDLDQQTATAWLDPSRLPRN